MKDNPDLPPIEDEEASWIGLTEVDPSPVEETPVEYKPQSYFPDQSQPDLEHGRSGKSFISRSPTSTLGLRLGDHGIPWWLHRIQKYSSYAFTLFTTFHIANTALIPLVTRSVSESNRYILLTRPYYQSALTEPLVVAVPLLAHIASGVALRFYRRRQALKRYGAETHDDRRTIPWPKISGTSALGYTLVPLVTFHSWTTRLLPIYMHGDSSLINLSYISHGFSRHPIISNLGFTILVSVGVWHFVWGAAKWLDLTPAQVKSSESLKYDRQNLRWYVINGISAAVTVLWSAGGLGVAGRGGATGGWIGREFDDLYKHIYRHVPFLGGW